LAIGFDNSPISTLDTPAEFNRTRAAHVARTALYGYLKTRTGIRYPAIFQDDRFTVSIVAGSVILPEGPMNMAFLLPFPPSRFVRM